MATGSLNVSTNSKIDNEIKALQDKDVAIENTLNTKANNDDIVIKSTSGNYIQIADAKDANMLLDHAPINIAIPYGEANTITTITKSGLTFTVNNDYSVTINGTATTGTYFGGWTFDVISGETYSFDVDFLPTNGNQNSYIYGYDGTNKWKRTGVFTASVTKKVTCGLYIDANKTLDNVTYYPRAYKGKNRYAYVPYSRYDVTACRKNLVDVSEISTWDILSQKKWCQKILRLKPNTNYTISQLSDRADGKNSNLAWLYIMSGRHTDLSVDWIQSFTNGCQVDTPCTITSDSEGWVTIGSLNTITTDIQIQLEEGDTATDYEPFIGKKVIIDRNTTFPLTGLDSYSELTNIYNSYGATMDVSYATNASGQSIMNKITNITNIINDKTGSTDISSIGDGTITGAIAALKEQIDAL